jgi:hypothetical protein
MTRSIAIASVVFAAAFAGSAFAESPIYANDAFTSTQTRAQVQTELAAYKHAGVNPWSTQYNPLRNFTSNTTRAAVVADFLAARDEVKALGSEDSGSAYLQAGTSASPVRTVAGQAPLGL